MYPVAVACLLSALGFIKAGSAQVLISDPNEFVKDTYDFIIIGGGTAGLTLATRLAESHDVGVIEAGTFHPDEPLIDVPLFVGGTLGNTTFDWGFLTTPQPKLNNRPIPANRGKVLGGSSALNFLIYGRGSKPEYDTWEELGNTGWNWDNFLPYFKKSATQRDGDSGIFPGTSEAPGTFTKFQGKAGPLQISYNTENDFLSGLFAPFAQAMQNLGSKANANPDSGNATGVFQTSRSVDTATGKRAYAVSYINATTHSGTLKILTGAEVSRINFAKSGKVQQALGCTFQANGASFTVKPTRELILSAGAFKTPQLLELSGIGNSALLKSLKIPVLVDLPSVGENLQDHLLVNSDFLLKQQSDHVATYDQFRNDPSKMQEAQQQYAQTHDGYFSASNAIVSFEPLQTLLDKKTASSIVKALDKEIAAKSKSLTYFQKVQYGIQRRLIDEGQVGQMEIVLFPGNGVTIPPLANRSYMSVSSFHSRPLSRGSSHINTTNFKDAPIINPNYFDFDFDSRVLEEATKAARRLAQTSPLAELIEGPSTPSSKVQSAADFKTFVSQTATTSFHGIGTAAMAPLECGGVVDANLRVYGTSNLRIVDASVFPMLFAAHTQSTVYALAERAADLIKGSTSLA
ncbi:hypothetical protein ONZ45_g6250 [Pleurotus djamor]|nr:hypothetical protein ONZ45_g6250 [Pleurotus djamor]